MTVSEWLNETVLYGGIPTRRADVEAHLDRLGVTGPARLAYSRLPVVDMEPVEIEEISQTEQTHSLNLERKRGWHS